MSAMCHYGRGMIGIVTILGLTASGASAAPSREDVAAAMKRAADFMMNTVSTRGGFVEKYTEDLSDRWGEIPARDSMIWVQDPGTVSVARTHLDAYKVTGDAAFLRAAERGANALVWGQHPAGGWHYFIDFDAAGVDEWYEKVAQKCWGWEEFYHNHGNGTFDDYTTIGAASFLLDLYMTTLDPKYRVPLLKAVDFVLDAQGPAGGWPQRYPPTAEHPDYTSCYTINDGVTAYNIFFLLRACRELGDPAYREAALRGMDFVVISQRGLPQAGWGQQHDMNLEPAGARNFEPKGMAPSTTVANIKYLETFYKITGDRKYLRGIPDALTWLDKARLPAGHSDQGHTHAQFVEIGTDRPLYAHREGTSIDQGRYWVDSEPGNFPGHYGMQLRIDVAALRAEYERVFALTPEQAMAKYAAEQNTKPATPKVSPEAVQKLIDSMNERGAWGEELSAPDYTDWKQKPRRHFRGISTRTYTKNMQTFVNYLKASAAGS